MADQREIQALRLAVVSALGVGVVVLTWATGSAGANWFLVWAIGGGFAAALVAPRWAGYGVLTATITLCAIMADTSDGFTGLTWLVVGALLVPATLGAVAGYAVVRIRRLGIRTAITDLRTLAAVGGVIVLVAVIASVAAAFATNPP